MAESGAGVYCLGCGAAFPIDADPYPLNGGMCAPCVAEGRQRPWQIIAENDRLRAENERLRLERDVLREALRFYDEHAPAAIAAEASDAR
jgi:hypothetical protein